ncbi:MAG: DMT family transporter [Trueperaceae bacterium]
MRAAPSIVPYLYLIASALFWAGNFVVARALRDAWSPVLLNSARWTIALAVLLPFAWGPLRAHWGTLRANLGWLLALAATGVVGFQTFVYLALATTPVVNAAILGATVPVVIALGAWFAYGERLGRLQAVGIAVSLAGALVVVARGDLATLATLRATPGDLWMAAAVPCWAAYTLLLRRAPAGLPQTALVASTSALGLLLLAPLLGWRLTVGETFPVAPAALAGALYIGLFPGLVAFVFWNRGVAAIGAIRAGSFLHLMPPFAAVLGVAFLGERLAGYHAAGAALVVAGLVLAGWRRSR